MKEHDHPPAARFPRCLHGFPESPRFPVHQFYRVGQGLFVQAHDPSVPVQIEGAFKGKALGPHQGHVLIHEKVSLQEGQLSLIDLIQFRRFPDPPEHVVVSPGQDLPARQAGYIIQIHLRFLKVPAPAVVSHQDQGIILTYGPEAVSQKTFFVIFPDGVMELARGLEFRLIMEMQISDRVQCHKVRLLSPGSGRTAWSPGRPDAFRESRRRSRLRPQRSLLPA